MCILRPNKSDFIKSFPDKFIILTNDLTYILQEWLDKPYQGIGLESKDKILGRDNISGRFNPELNQYVILDSQNIPI